MVEPKIQPRQQFFVEGQVQYSDVSQLVQGERLETINERRKTNGQPTTRPYTAVTVINPKIVHVNRNETETEQAVENKHFYATRREPNTLHFQGARYKYENARRPYELPWIAIGDLNTKHVKQITLHKEEEISKGRTVILCLRTFQGSQGRAGTILDGVIVPLSAEEAAKNPRAPFESRSSANISQELAQLGLTLDNPTIATEPTDIPAAKLDKRNLPDGFSADKPEPEKTTQNTTASAQKPETQSTNASQTKQDNGVEDLWNGFGDDTQTETINVSNTEEKSAPKPETKDSSKQAADDWFAN